MIGNEIIVKPVLEKDATHVNIWLPKCETWFHIFTEKKYLGIDDWKKVPISLNNFGLFVKAGSIIPVCRVDE